MVFKGVCLESELLSRTRVPAQNATVYNTRIQKGGALIEEMRQLVRYWREGRTEEITHSVIRSNVLNKTTRARAADILRRTFIPRFVDGTPRNAWRLIRPLEDQNASPQLVKPLYYWISAKAEPLIFDFCQEYLLHRLRAARAGITVEDVRVWLVGKGCEWSPGVTTRVARGLLAAFRDFGILEGRSQKRLASFILPVGSFAYLAFCLHREGALGRNLVFHPDWHLFLLQTPAVEHYFLEAHQRRLIAYHAAGSTINISFPCEKLEDYARVVVERSN
jgi:hypothetical protein